MSFQKGAVAQRVLPMNFCSLQKEEALWRQLLGDWLYDRLIREPDSAFIPAGNLIPGGEQGKAAEKVYRRFCSRMSRAESAPEYAFLQDGMFGVLTGRAAAAFLGEKRGDEGAAYAAEENYRRFFPTAEKSDETLVRILYEAVRNIPVRVCIYEIRILKQEGLLCGESVGDEYAFYCGHYLQDPVYLQELSGKYPEMLRLLWVRLEFQYQNLLDFFSRLHADRNLLEQKLGGGKKLQQVTGLMGNGSDSHRGGKTVIQCCLDHDTWVIYKPHGIKKEILYRNLYDWFRTIYCISIGFSCVYAVYSLAMYSTLIIQSVKIVQTGDLFTILDTILLFYHNY